MGSVVARGFGFTHKGGARPALRDIDFDIGPGQCLLVVGPSGSGKSTLALAIAGLVGRDVPGSLAGHLEVGGRPVASATPAELAAQVGLVFQDPASQLVMERMGDDVAFGLETRAWPVGTMQARVPEALTEVGLGGMERRRSRDASGGQQQRLALAGVTAPRPRVLVLDEPTANLDPEGTASFFRRLSAIRASGETTIVLVEHRVDDAWPLADLVLALGSDGAPIAVGSPAQVLAHAGTAMASSGIWLPDHQTTADDATPIRRTHVHGDVLVRADRVGFAYQAGAAVLDDVSFEVRAGERVALIGPNGSGKSTLGRLLVGLLRPQRGRLVLAGTDPAALPSDVLARRAGYVFQEPERQFLTNRVDDEVRLGLTAAEGRTVSALMARLDLPLEVFGARSPYRLSGGEARRLSLACVLVRRPGLLVLDEPTFGQDRHGYESLLAILGQHFDDGAALVAATHDPRFVRDVTDRTVALDRGRVVRDDATASAA
jgi:energy-coupling factor transport system ATP-binding protein